MHGAVFSFLFQWPLRRPAQEAYPRMGIWVFRQRRVLAVRERHWNGAAEHDDERGEVEDMHVPGGAGGQPDLRVRVAGLGACAVDEALLELLRGEEVGLWGSVQLRRDAVVALGAVHGADDVGGVVPWGGRLAVPGLFGV